MYGNDCPSGAMSNTPVMIAMSVVSPVSFVCTATCNSYMKTGRVAGIVVYSLPPVNGIESFNQALFTNGVARRHKITSCDPKPATGVMPKTYPLGVRRPITQLAPNEGCPDASRKPDLLLTLEESRIHRDERQ